MLYGLNRVSHIICPTRTKQWTEKVGTNWYPIKSHIENAVNIVGSWKNWGVQSSQVHVLNPILLNTNISHVVQLYFVVKWCTTTYWNIKWNLKGFVKTTLKNGSHQPIDWRGSGNNRYFHAYKINSIFSYCWL